MTTTCVFCGQPIGPDEEIAGRGAAIAHARCADAALADDAHWDAIAAASGEHPETKDEAGRDETAPADAGGRARRAGGCLTLALAILATGAVLTAGRRVARR